MKAWQRMALAAALIAALGLAGCQSKASANTQGNAQGNGQGQPTAIDGTMGIVTAISDNSMPQGQGFGQGGPQGTGRPQGGPQNSAQPDQGQAPGGPDSTSGATVDTSGWEQKTYAIDSSTKITKMSRANGDSNSAQSTAIKASDIKSGESVRITERSGQTGTADTISVMGAFGRGNGQGNPGNGGQGGGQNQGNSNGDVPSSNNKV